MLSRQWGRGSRYLAVSMLYLGVRRGEWSTPRSGEIGEVLLSIINEVFSRWNM
jgi:hypothetical protein